MQSYNILEHEKYIRKNFVKNQLTFQRQDWHIIFPVNFLKKVIMFSRNYRVM